MRKTTAFALSAAAEAFLFEFQKDPVPTPSSYWILGQFSVKEGSKDGNAMLTGKPEARFELKTIAENLKDAAGLDSALSSMHVGITESWVLDKMKEDLFCCNGKHGDCEASEFSLASPKGKHADKTYTVALKQASSGPSVHTPKAGTYSFWVANCAKETHGVKLVGSVKVKSAGGYLPPEFSFTNTFCFYLGFVYVVLALLFLFYPSFPAAMRPMTLCFAAFVSTAAVRLLLVGPYANFLWNTSAVEASGRTAVEVAGALQAGVFFLLWDMLNSQYFVGGNPISGSEKMAAVGLSILVCFAVFVPGAWRGDDGTRPPPEFFKNAQAATETPPESTGLLATYNLTMTDVYMLVFLLFTLLPGLSWAERRESLVAASEFSTKVLHPLRSGLMSLIILTIVAMIGWDFSSSQLPVAEQNVGFALETGVLIEKAAPELGMVVASLMIARGLLRWDGSSASAGKYGVVNTDEVELGQVDEGGDYVEDEVNNYDPDKLGEEREQRVRLE